MRRLAWLLRGWRGHPLHPPLTDVTIGSFTVTAVAVVVGWAGFVERRMLDVAFLSAVIGIISAAFTILTGFADYVRIRRGTAMRRTVNLHWVVNLLSIAAFTGAAALLQPGWNDGQMPVGGGILVLAAYGGIAFGGWVGGSIVFYYGMRVIGEPQTPTREALKPKFPPHS